MKKYFSIALAAFAILSLSIACNKEAPTPDEQIPANENKEDVTPAGEQITITATLSDALTRVSFTPNTGDDGKTTSMSIAWALGDQIRVYNHNDRSLYEDFTLDESAVGQQVGTFSGTAITADSYDVEVINGTFDYNNQNQPSDGLTDNLKYLANASNIADYTDITFTEFSSVLAITAKMPSTAVAQTIKSIDMTASEAIFNGSKSLTITFHEARDAGNDGILHIFATLPIGDTPVPAGTTLLVHFNAPNSDHTVYTRFVDLGNSGLTFTANTCNTININAAKSDKHAGLISCTGSSADDPYLIADKYQMDAIHDLLVADETLRYFKMIDDIDMTGITWVPLNNVADESGHYSKYIYFDGNDFTLSGVKTASESKPDYPSVFGVLNGTVTNLTIDHATIAPAGDVSGGKSAILAAYIGSSDCTVSPSVNNITIMNSTVGTSSDKGGNYCGGLAAQMGKAGSTVSNITISDCSVATTNYAGGMIAEIGAATTITGTNIVANTDVYGSLAGGVIGFMNAKCTMNGCTYTGGNVTGSARYVGGMLGSTGNQASVISDCHVPDATINAASDRAGGFVGQLQTKVTVKGCTVGTTGKRVTVNSQKTGATVNVGGFVGVCYGTITKNGNARNKAFVKITSANNDKNAEVRIGGFVGYHEAATIEYSDADADMPDLKGQQIGGFAAYLTAKAPGCVIDNCTAEATVTGGNYTGGFIGKADAADHIITKNIVSGTVNASSTVGGFVGQASKGSWIGNTTSSTVSGATNIGGFAGQINGDVTVSKCSSTGESVSASGNVCGGFTAIAANGAKISDCYSTTNLSGTTRKRGGLIGHVTEGTVTVERCYASGTIDANFELGGLVGFVAVSTFTMSKSAAWNTSVTASYRASDNWSSASIVGVAELTCTLTDNYRNPNMFLAAYWGTSGYGVELTTDFQQPNVSSSSPLTDWDGNTVTSGTMRPYNGKCETGKTLCQLAKTTLGWSSDVWNMETGILPTLK